MKKKRIAVPDPIVKIIDLALYYGKTKALKEINLDISKKKITSFIGPSGCGKSTLIRCLNRINDLIDSVTIEGSIRIDGQDIYAPTVDVTELRKKVGMVFQKPNPFPKSIYENVAWAARIHGYKGDMDELVEFSLRQAALWDEVKDKLKQSGLSLSGGLQQRFKAVGKVQLYEEGGRLVIAPAADDPIAAATGFLTGKFSLTDDLRREDREEARREQKARSR